MKHSHNTTINIALSLLSIGLSAYAFAQPPEELRGQRIENLTFFGFDLPFVGNKESDNLTPVPHSSTYGTPTNAEFELPAQSVEFKPLLPDLSHLQTLLTNPNDLGEISLSPVSGMYQVVIANEIYYLSQDGRYLFEGNLLDLSTRRNLSDIQRNQIRNQLLSELNEMDVIAFSLPKPRHQVTVFIDVDCPYCRVVYDNVAHYNQLGIEMHFAPFPRNGPNSVAYMQLSSIWCAPDRKQAMQDINQGLLLSSVNCPESIKKSHIIGMKLGVNATPTFVLENGSLIKGYVAPQNLARMLSETK